MWRFRRKIGIFDDNGSKKMSRRGWGESRGVWGESGESLGEPGGSLGGVWGSLGVVWGESGNIQLWWRHLWMLPKVVSWMKNFLFSFLFYFILWEFKSHLKTLENVWRGTINSMLSDNLKMAENFFIPECLFSPHENDTHKFWCAYFSLAEAARDESIIIHMPFYMLFPFVQ